MDVILTDIGRDQMNRGEFEVSFVSFSDKGSEYVDDGTGVAADITDRLYFESFSSPADEIIPEISNEGDFILTRQVSPTLTVNNGVLFEKTSTGYQQVDAFANIGSFTSILPGRFEGLQIIRSFNDVEDFNVSAEQVQIKLQANGTVPPNSDLLKPILVDERFSGSTNTLYLPPTSEIAGKTTTLRAYNRYGRKNTKNNVLKEIRRKSRGSTRIELGSLETFEEYNIIGQAFMKSDQTVKKYLIVDAGEYLNEKNEIIMQVYHLGFISKNEEGISKFTRGFSLVFHNDDIQGAVEGAQGATIGGSSSYEA